MTREEARQAIIKVLWNPDGGTPESVADRILDAIRDVLIKTVRGQAKTTEVWEAYSKAMFKAWGIELQPNAQIRSQMSALIDHVGKDLAPKVAEFYVDSKEAFFYRAKHPFGLLLRDWHKFLLEYQGAKTVTLKTAEANETYSATVDSAKRYYDKKHGNG